MSFGNPYYGLLKKILDIIAEYGVAMEYDTDWVTEELKRRNAWSYLPRTPERTVNSYFSQHPELFRRIRPNRYALTSTVIERQRRQAIDESAARLLPTITADAEVLYEELPPRTDVPPQERRSTYYERDPRLRALAVAIHGTTCMICGFNFGDYYGDWGKDYIEVHHVVPIAEVPESYETNPETDMVVLCSNCHRMIHRRRGYTLTVEELKEKIGPNQRLDRTGDPQTVHPSGQP